MYNSFNESQLRLSAIAEKEAIAFARIITETLTDREELQQFLKSLFFNHTILENDQFAVYLELMYEYIGLDLPDDMDCYLATDQKSIVYFSSFLTSLLTAIAEKTRGDYPCPVM